MVSTKTIILENVETSVTGLTGSNTLVINNSSDPVYASRNEGITPYTDEVIEIAAGARDTIVGTNGTVYLLGSGRVELRGVDYVGFNAPSSSIGTDDDGNGINDTTKAYIDAQDKTTFISLKTYTDKAVDTVKTIAMANADDITDLQTDMSMAQTTIMTDGARIAATESAISTLNGTGAGSVTKAVADGIAEIVAGAPASLDTLKEISDWIETHSDSASAMNTQIQTNSTNISNLQTSKANKTDIPTSLPANGGNAATAEKLKTSRKINDVAFDGSADITIKAEANGGNAATVNGHTVAKDVPADAKFTDTTYTAATVTPKANGTATVGTSAKYAREDHVHPLQTSVSGNAGTATKLQTARKINGVVFDGSADITVTAVDSTARTAASNAQTTANANATNITSLQSNKFDKTGGTISGDVRIKNDTDYGTKLIFGNLERVYLNEDTDDHLFIHAYDGVLIDGQKIKLDAGSEGIDIATSGPDASVRINTNNVGVIIDGIKYSPFGARFRVTEPATINLNTIVEPQSITFYLVDSDNQTIENGVPDYMRGWVITMDFLYGAYGAQFYMSHSGNVLYRRMYGYDPTSNAILFTTWAHMAWYT